MIIFSQIRNINALLFFQHFGQFFAFFTVEQNINQPLRFFQPLLLNNQVPALFKGANRIVERLHFFQKNPIFYTWNY